MKYITLFILLFTLQNRNLLGQNRLTFDIVILQDSIEMPKVDNKINLRSNEFEIEIKMPVNMLKFEKEKYSSINYIATLSKSYADSIADRKCFNCGYFLTPYAFDKYNSEESLIIGREGYSFWIVSNDTDENNVSNYKIVNNQIIARVKIKKLLVDKEDKYLNEFKGTIYLLLEAVDRSSSKVGNRTYMEIIIK